jgi:hypothetical protein
MAPTCDDLCDIFSEDVREDGYGDGDDDEKEEAVADDVLVVDAPIGTGDLTLA